MATRPSLLVEFVFIASPNRYDAPRVALSKIADFSASVLALFTAASTAVEFLAAYLASALLLSPETILTTESRVSDVSHSGAVLSHPFSKSKIGRLQKTFCRFPTASSGLVFGNVTSASLRARSAELDRGSERSQRRTVGAGDREASWDRFSGWTGGGCDTRCSSCAHGRPPPQAVAASRLVKSAGSWAMPSVSLIKHEVVRDCGSDEVRIDGWRSRFFYWDDLPSRRLRSEQMTGAQALELAKSLARGLSMTR